MNPSFGISYMWAAYAAVWIIHAAYLLWMRSQASQLNAEIEEAKRG